MFDVTFVVDPGFGGILSQKSAESLQKFNVLTRWAKIGSKVV